MAIYICLLAVWTQWRALYLIGRYRQGHQSIKKRISSPLAVNAHQ